MIAEPASYGLWSLAAVNALVFLLFAFSFARPRTARDWRSFGAFAASLVALFTEMYGFPLTVYLLSGWLAPRVDLAAHEAGHLLEILFGWRAHPHLGPFHLASLALIGGGFWLLAAAWPVLHRAQRDHRLATTGPYASIRHPQYVGFVLIMLGFLLQWPTLPTLVLFPLLVAMYARLARREDADARERFGTDYDRYAAATPAFVPRWGGAPRPRPPAADPFRRLSRRPRGKVAVHPLRNFERRHSSRHDRFRATRPRISAKADCGSRRTANRPETHTARAPAPLARSR